MGEAALHLPTPEEVAARRAAARDTGLHLDQRLAATTWLANHGLEYTDDPPPQPPPHPTTFEPNVQGTPRNRYESIAYAKANGVKLPPSEVISVRMSEVEREEISWLWPNRFALGKVSLLQGDTEQGKSHITVSMAATITTGGCWPDQPGKPVEKGSCIFLMCEDDLNDTFSKRLDAAGADAAKVHVVDAVKLPGGQEAGFSIGRDLDGLAVLVEKIGDVRLLVIDPISAYLGSSDEHKNADVRHNVLNPLKRFCKKYRLCTNMVQHMNKGGAANVLHRSMGTVAFMNFSRTAWFVSAHPFDKTRRLMTYLKSNISPHVGGLSFFIDDSGVHWDPEPVEWRAQQVSHWLNKNLERGEDAGERGPKPKKTRGVAQLIEDRVKDGPAVFSQVLASAIEAGASRQTFYNAFKMLQGKVETYEEGGRQWLRRAPSLPLDASPVQSFPGNGKLCTP